MSTTEIIWAYTKGEKTLEETNAALKEAGSNVYLDPERNTLTAEEMAATTVGYTPDKANGWGLLDSGTGTFDKVEVRNGELVNCDMGEQTAMVLICGKTYYVDGTKLVDEDPHNVDGAPIPKEPDMKRRTDLAGQVVRQKTKAGVYDVTYDEDGYAVKATRVVFN